MTDAIWTTIIPISREKFEADRAALAAQQIVIEGDSGTITHPVPFGHATVEYAYDGAQLTLRLTECPRIARGKAQSVIAGWFQSHT